MGNSGTLRANKVQLAVPWYYLSAEKADGKRVYVLDPQNDFLPIRCDSRWDYKPIQGQPQWRVENLAVEDRRLVGDVWMPTRFTETTRVSRHVRHLGL